MINICLGSWYHLPCAQVQDIHKMQGWTSLPPCPRSLILGMLPPEGFTLHFWTWKPSPKFRNLEWESGREGERDGQIDWLTWDLPLAWCYHSGGDSIPNQPEWLDLQAMMYQVAASHMLPESQYTMQEKWYTLMIYICKTIEDFTHIRVLGAFSSLFLKVLQSPTFLPPTWQLQSWKHLSCLLPSHSG
jgi:hypothetical protein